MKILENEEIRSRQLLSMKTKVPMATRRWHEGSELLGYWPDGDSYVFKVDGHYLAISKMFIVRIAEDNVDFVESGDTPTC